MGMHTVLMLQCLCRSTVIIRGTKRHRRNEEKEKSFFLVVYKAVYSNGSQLMFQRKLSSTSSGSENKPSKPVSCWLLALFTLQT
jgi:hypothetical protein